MHKIALISAFLFLTICAFAQPNNAYLKNVTMPSPEAASLGKYGDIPVGYYTGVPNVGIPIHTVSEGPLSLSVSLSYHASGLKVAETPSWVGLNWTLAAGGMISRTMQSLRDEEGTVGWLKSSAIPAQPFPTGTGTWTNDYCAFYTHVFGNNDSEPDIFSFNFPGGSGKFYFKKDGTVVQVPIQQIKITPQLSTSEPYLKGFIVTTPDGTKYHFGDTGIGKTDIELSTGGGGDMPEYASGWYLNRIESADGNYQINLNYVNEGSQTDYRPSTIGCDGSAPNGDPTSNLARKNTFVKGRRLSSITSSTETVTFTAGAVRTDLENFPGAPAGFEAPKTLGSILISTGTTVTYQKKFDFTYSYWEDLTADKVTAGSLTVNKRLRLLSVQEKSGNGTTIVNPAWTFEYFTKTGNVDFLPHRLSRSVDHWGFYNGADNGIYNSSTPNIPGQQTNTCFSGQYCTNDTYTYPGTANRETNETFMKYGTLKRVNYPTGGYTDFDFEANDYYSPTTIPQITTLVKIDHNYGGGGICASLTSVGIPNPVLFQSADLPNLKFNWALKPASSCSCSGGQVTMEVKVYTSPGNVFVATSGQFQVNCTSTNGSTGTGNLTTLFPTLQPQTNYRFEIFGVNAAAKFYITKQTSVPAGNVKVGGLRIKQIITYDGINTANNIIRSYTYRDSVNTANSSGQLYNQPTYSYSYSWYPCSGSNCGSVCAPSSCPLYQLSSGGCNVSFYESSVVPLGSFEGYHIGYKHVKEAFNGNGYKTYTYATESVIANQFPNPPAPARILAGNLIHAVTRSEVGALITSESHQAYGDSYIYSSDVMYKKSTNNCGSFLTVYSIRTRPYREASLKNVLDGIVTKTTYTYSSNTNYDVINNHLFPVSQSVTNSDGKVHKTEYKYPFDSETANIAIMNDMKARYIVADPWRSVVRVDTTQVNGTEIEYAYYNTTTGGWQSGSSGAFPRVYKYYNFEKTWTSGTLTGTGKTLRGTIGSYNNKGLPASFTAANWLAETYTWETNGLIKTKTYNGYVTTYDYAAGTRLVSKITQPDGQESWFDYDQLMRVVKAWALPSTAGTKSTAKVTTDYDYRYRNQPFPLNPMPENYVKTITTFATAPIGGGTSGLATKEAWQYMDGIGRPYQSVNRKQSPAQKDVVNYITYDKWGRAVKQYNPVESTVNTGAPLATEPTASPYTLSEYYTDPLSRPWKVTPPFWFATEYTYGANVGGEVLLNHTTSSHFDADALSKTTVKDPDNKVIISYKDKQGRTILTKRTDTANSGPANTYNIYDDKDRLTKVIPPGSTFASTTLNFEYTYDQADNMLTKKVPDAALVTMKYNTRDQLVLEQDGNLLSLGNWRCIQYDDFGRVIKTGLFSGAIPSPITTSLTPSDLYTENIYGTVGIEKGKIKISKTKAIDTGGTWLYSTNTFDAYGRVSSSTGNNYLLPLDSSAETITYIYDYADNILKDTRVSKKIGSVSNTIAQTHNYDHWGRNTLNTHKVNTGTLYNISQIAYDWKNQVIEKNMGLNPQALGTTYLQSLDYAYNDQGWLTTINTASLGGTNTGFPACLTVQGMPNPGTASGTPDQNDLFYLELKYNQLQSGLTGTAAKNGNISQVIWRTRGRERQAYSLTYDYLDRMIEARYDNISDAGTVNNTSAWDENLVYDIRGNINTLTRTGKYKTTPSATCWTNGQIDALTYTYNTNTNKLQKIADAAPAASKANGWNNPAAAPGTAQYGYDANGNMITDPYKNLEIIYNFLNLPQKMTFSLPSGAEQTIDILYDGSGRKLRKTVKDGGVLQYTQDYVGGIEYRTTSAVSLSLESIGHGEGRVFNTNTGTTSADVLRYEYSIKDHLGNTRLTFTDKNGNSKIDVTTTASNEVLQENHYYPFGLSMNGPWMNDAVMDNKYQYNGKEINDDFGLGWNDYGARWYDAVVARFWNPDPIIENFSHLTPYNYASLEPIGKIDFYGLQGFTFVHIWHALGVTGTSTASMQAKAQNLQNKMTFKFSEQARNRTRLALNGAKNFTMGYVGAYGSVAAEAPTLGASTVPLVLSISEMGMGFTQLCDALFGENPDPNSPLHKAGTIFGAALYANESPYAELGDALTQFTTGVVAGGNLYGPAKTISSAIKDKKAISTMDALGTYDAYSDAKGLENAVTGFKPNSSLSRLKIDMSPSGQFQKRLMKPSDVQISIKDAEEIRKMVNGLNN